MKKYFYSLIILLTTILISCDKNEIIESKKSTQNDYNSNVSQNRVLLAKSLIESINTNSKILSTIINECNKKIDGDREVLCKKIFEMNISTDSKSKIGSMINGSSQIKKSKSLAFDNFTNIITTQDSLIQIYFYVCNDNDSTSFEGIVVKPENYKEGEGKDLLVINKDGSSSYIRSDIEPDKNYLVISRNERANYVNTPNKIIYSKIKENNVADGKIMHIVQATFTSMAAKRTVEDWIDGEPEVRLNVLYALISPINNSIVEARNSTFLYPKKWLNLGLFVNKVKWNTSLVECPFWYSSEKNYGRRLIWTEEDGATAPTTISSNWPDKTTGITTTITTNIPATDNDKLIADSWIDYDLIGDGATYTWSIIKFQINCK